MNTKIIIKWTFIIGILASLAIGALSLIIYLFVWLPATFEATAFNKFSKIKATPWDAIWTDLKVTSQ